MVLGCSRQSCCSPLPVATCRALGVSWRLPGPVPAAITGCDMVDGRQDPARSGGDDATGAHAPGAVASPPGPAAEHPEARGFGRRRGHWELALVLGLVALI